jgi:glutamate-1-semialdehyde aminotransferase
MAKRVTTVRMPQELAEEVEAVARGRGMSINAVVLDAVSAEIQRVRNDAEFMAKLREIAERDKEILDRLAQ